jgi:hypothetical protein
VRPEEFFSERSPDEVYADPGTRYLGRAYFEDVQVYLAEHRATGTIWRTRERSNADMWSWCQVTIVEATVTFYRDNASDIALDGDVDPRVAFAGPITRFMVRHGSALASVSAWAASPAIVRAVHVALAGEDGWAAVRALGTLRRDPHLEQTSIEEVLANPCLDLESSAWAWCVAARELGATAEDDGQGLVRRPAANHIHVRTRADELLASANAK